MTEHNDLSSPLTIVLALTVPASINTDGYVYTYTSNGRIKHAGSAADVD